MESEEAGALYDLAVEMAIAVFKDASPDHVDAILERLDFNERHGLGLVGAITVH